MNKEQIEEAKKFFDNNFEFFNYKKELTKESCVALMVEYLESKREEIERKAYEAGMTEMFYSFRYNTGVKEISKDFISKRYDQWKESQKKEQ